MGKRHRGDGSNGRASGDSDLETQAGRRSLTTQLKRRRGERRRGGAKMHESAQRGVSGQGGELPHREQIQESFGEHDVSGVSAHVGGEAGEAADAIGAEAYATGNDVAFSQQPDLHTAAHEAAHVVQQRGGVQLKGGVGQEGDAYERHADAVADKVVAGESAAGLLSQMAPAGGGAASGGGGVQRLQLRIKDDLEEAMDGWGTDEDAIYNRLRRATPEELKSVVNDSGLMSDLRDELSSSEMRRVLRLLNAPIKMKLELAMDGWGTDEGYIQSTLRQASPAQLASVAADEALLSRLEGELSGGDLRSVLDRLPVPLSRKLSFAMRGWGTDEQYIFDSIHSAPINEVIALSQDSATMGELDGELSGGEWAECRATIARRLYNEAAMVLEAFDVMATSDDDQRNDRLRRFGPQDEMRKLCDIYITIGTDVDKVKWAFESYWDIDTGLENATDDEGNTIEASAWDLATIRGVHEQLKVLPERDTRSNFFNTLIRVANSGGGYMSTSGRFGLGEDATGGTADYGAGTYLSSAASAGDAEISVDDASVFQDGATIRVGNGPNAEVHSICGCDTSANKFTLESALTNPQAARARVTPDDGTGLRQVDWLGAVVRHEIGHAVDNQLGGVWDFKRGLGGWEQGTDIDSWISTMGSAWSTSDGSDVSDEDKDAIKDRIDDVRGTDGTGLREGLDADHAMVRYYDSDVPVIEAAKTAEHGKGFWTDPTRVPAIGGKRFSINCYYHRYQSYNDQVQTSRVRDYQIFSPAEFFAEIYTVFYEQAGSVPDEQLGALVPVSSWAQWIRQNVHERGHSPQEEDEAGNNSAPIGAKANNPGSDS